MALIKVKANARNRHEIAELAGIFRARIDHVDQESVIVETAGRRDKVQAMIDMLRPYGIIEMARTGQIVVGRRDTLRGERADRRSPSGSQDKAPEPDSGIYNIYQTNKGM
jgi:acetolactate synthase-1/3 small subunit